MVDHALDVSKRRGTEVFNPPIPPDETFDLIGHGENISTVTAAISDVVLKDRLRPGWLLFLGFSMTLLMMMIISIAYLIVMGTGIWGVNIPVGWGFAIINFVWWIGIGHAGTLISAILLLLHQNWRTSINRFAEAMTIFAVMCAGLFPALHIGRHQYFYWLIPLPNSMSLWPQFRSPLEWDFFAVSTYFTVSALFWYVGLLPDLATLRDRTNHRLLKVIYGMASLGWRGSHRHWHRYMAVYLILAGISTPLVLSVHSTISFDFAVGIVPGWHTTIFPPYFVAGAVYAGFAMVLLLAIPLRAVFGLKHLVTMRHLENCAKVMLATGLVVFYGYCMEAFTSWYGGNKYEQFMSLNRLMGPYAWSYWALIFCNGIAPQVLWFRKVRTNVVWLFVMSIVVSIGMWLERFVIVITSLHRDFIPSSWAIYNPTGWDWSLYIGTMGLFLTLFLLFVRALPSIAMAEMRELVHHHGHTGGTGDLTVHELHDDPAHTGESKAKH